MHLNPELEARLSHLAAEQGCDDETLAREAIERLMDHDEWFVREVDKGLSEIELGKVITHEEVGRRLEKRLAEKQSRSRTSRQDSPRDLPRSF